MAEGETTAAEGQTSAPPARHRSWWSRLRADMGRSIEHRGLVLWYLMFERGLKSLLLVAASIYVFTHTETGFSPLVSRLIEILNLDSGRGLIHDLVVTNLVKLAGMPEHTLWVLGIGSLIYGLIEGAESVGLLLRRRWAEYLVVAATAFFIPFEVLEIFHRPSPLRIITFVINVAVVIYLIRKKQLFHPMLEAEA